MKKRIAWIIVGWLRRLGFDGLDRLAQRLAALVWRCAGKRREYTVRQVQERLGLTEPEARRIARQSYTETFRSFLELLLVYDIEDFERRVITPGWKESWNKAIDFKRPIVAFTAHFGAWEFLAAIAGQTKGRPVVCVTRRQKDPVINELIADLRLSSGLVTIDHRDAASTVLGYLRQNGIAAFVVDHNCSRDEAVFLPFLGKLAAVNMGPALLAVRSKALVHPMLLKREPGGKYSVYCGETLDTATLEGSISEKVRAVAEFYTRTVERQVLECPEQWFWMHKRWKTRPPGEKGGKEDV